MRTYAVWFVRDWGNIQQGTYCRLPEDEAIAAVTGGFAVYYVS